MNPEKTIISEINFIQMDGSDVDSSYYRCLSTIMKEVHDQIPKQKFNKFRAPCKTQFREEFFNGKNLQRAVI